MARHRIIAPALKRLRSSDLRDNATAIRLRIPRHARDAVARHEPVVVENRERPVFVIVHPDDSPAAAPPARRGRPLGETLIMLAAAALPDPAFADDMEAVLADAGPVPEDPWARS